jgi:hypothetical protein
VDVLPPFKVDDCLVKVGDRTDLCEPFDGLVLCLASLVSQPEMAASNIHDYLQSVRKQSICLCYTY